MNEIKTITTKSNPGLLHTPEGVRDIYNSECARKNKVQNSIQEIIYSYGFKAIETPTFEFFDIFNKERGTIASKEMYKFFDKEGNTLVLRPDFTPSIARCAAKYFKEENFPIRLCYVGNTFVNTSRYQGKLKEVTQVGAELINDGSVDADVQMLALTIESLLKAGLTEFQIEIGHADFFNGIVEEANLDDEKIMELKELIEQKNLFGTEEICNNSTMSSSIREVIMQLPELFGDSVDLDRILEKIENNKAKAAIHRLKELLEIIELYGYKKYVSIDLGMLSKYNYYTGIIFRAYTYGTGDVIVTGGRYDNLVKQFGKNAPAIGFAIVIDQLMLALSRQKVKVSIEENNTLLLYDEIARETAIQLSKQFRATNICVELLKKEKDQDLESYIAYGRRNRNGGILYLKEDSQIDIIELSTGKMNHVSVNELLSE